jgi:hypothetical protein
MNQDPENTVNGGSGEYLKLCKKRKSDEENI